MRNFSDLQIADLRWYREIYDNALETVDGIEDAVKKLNLQPNDFDLAYDVVAESGRSINDIVSLDSGILRSTLFYYGFDYVPFPQEFETNCHIDIRANKLVLPYKERIVAHSVEDVYISNGVVEDGDNEVCAMPNSGDFEFSIAVKAEEDVNFIGFELLNDGVTGNINSIVSNEVEQLYKPIEILPIRRVSLYVEPSDEFSINISGSALRLGSSLFVRNFELKQLKYSTSGMVELRKACSGNLELETGVYGSVTLKVIRDGSFYGSFQVYDGDILRIDCDKGLKLQYLLSSDSDTTPMLKYIKLVSKAGVADVL